MTNIENIDKPYPFTDDQEAWLRDLETTDAKQGKEYLHIRTKDGDDEFCCLGRACVVMNVPETIEMNVGMFSGQYVKFLSPELYRRMRLISEDGLLKEQVIINGNECESLVDMNDIGNLSFKQIAAYIRGNPWNVFENLGEDGQ